MFLLPSVLELLLLLLVGGESLSHGLRGLGSDRVELLSGLRCVRLISHGTALGGRGLSLRQVRLIGLEINPSFLVFDFSTQENFLMGLANRMRGRLLLG